MIEIKDKSLCSGCYACYSVCPKDCILMQTDSEGFYYPAINQSDCINCGRCQSVCPILNEPELNNIGKAYACINKNEDIRKNSSSGGIFSELATYVIANNGIVFGAAFDKDWNVVHTCINNLCEIEKLQGSKYVQSKIGDTYKQTRDYLEKGQLVLYTGTPCQVSGLLKFLDKKYDNLITQDLICHGVPSPKVWQKYVDFQESNATSKIKRAIFKYKKPGWKKYSVLFEFESGQSYEQLISNDLFMQVFLRDICLRPSCYNCHSKKINRTSDITLADFWGIERISPDMFDDKGTSLVIINSEKGNKLFNAISSNLIYKKVNFCEAIKQNSAIHTSVKQHKNRNKFFQNLDKMNFDVNVTRVTNIKLPRKILNKLKQFLKRSEKPCSKIKHYS